MVPMTLKVVEIIIYQIGIIVVVERIRFYREESSNAFIFLSFILFFYYVI